MENDEKVGVIINKCEFEKNNFVCLPTVSLQLLNSKTGENLSNGENDLELTTQPFNAIQKRFGPYLVYFEVVDRCSTPSWDDILICNFSYDKICNPNNTEYIFLFEICDNIQEPSSMLKNKQLDVIKKRIAWAFFKPISNNGHVNLGKIVRLQLYKIGKKCSLSHQSCPLYHLYSNHKRKKYAGSLYVEIKGVMKDENIAAIPLENKVEPDEASKIVTITEIVVPSVAVAEWSRLPTQSCKLPNTKLAEIPISHRGASCITFSNSGSYLACGAFSKILIVNVLDRNEITRLIGHTGLIYELQWARDDSLLLSVSADCSAIIWNVKPISKTSYFILPHPSFVYCGKWIKSGHHIVTGGKDLTLRFWKRSELGFDLLEEIGGHAGFITALQGDGDSLLFSGDSTGHVIIWRLEQNKWLISRKLNFRDMEGSAIDAIHLHPEQRRIIISARSRGSLMIDISTGAIVQIYKATSFTVRSVTCLSPCGSLFFSFGAKNAINCWECDTGNLIATYENIFSGFYDAELSGYITYHPFEHLAAFAVLGCNYPIVLLQHDYKNDDSIKLGLTTMMKKLDNTETRKDNYSTKTTDNVFQFSVDHSTEDKLAAIVRNIDRVLIAKREMTRMLGNLNKTS